MRGGEHVSEVLNDHAQTCAAAVHSQPLTPFQNSNRVRPSFSDEIEDDDDSTHITDNEDEL